MDYAAITRFKTSQLAIALLFTSANSFAHSVVTVCSKGCSYTTIQSGIDAARSGETVRVQAGTYREAIHINKALILKGVGGKARTVIDATNLGRSAVTMSAPSTLQGFTVTGGSSDYGGGIKVTAGIATISDNVIRDNRANRNGGGVWIQSNARASIVNNSIRRNVAGEGGGGVTTEEYVTVVIDNNTFIANRSQEGGAVVAASYANTTVTRNVFDRNSASNGGALFLSAYSSQSNNSSSEKTLKVEGNMLKNNIASLRGGGVFMATYSFATIANNVVVKNRALRGGGVYIDAYSSVNVVSSTIADNVATEMGGVAVESYSGANIVNSIMWNNENGQVEQQLYGGAKVFYSDIQGGYPGLGSNNIDADPLFVDTRGSNYRLRTGSPALDSGRDTRPDFGVATDFNGLPRPQDGDGYGAGNTGDGSDFDMGAFEMPAG